MKVTSNALRSHLPEANQAFKQGKKVKDVGQKSAKESESENISQDWVNQHFRRKYQSKLHQSTFSLKSLD
ncbi:hypothetical protein LCGC14_1752290 [marine sediment metagenome]|uniref:Uncharacterized protein n=1 Tax=marine sediment metagenome TaxID=412755 RepID=A0A0F9H3N5_9ZZZZ